MEVNFRIAYITGDYNKTYNYLRIRKLAKFVTPPAKTGTIVT